MAAFYTDYVSKMTLRNPSLGALSDFLGHQPRTTCNSIVSYAEVGETGEVGPSQKTSTSRFMAWVNSGLANSIVLVVENIHPEDIEVLGSSLGINPFFFCGHIASGYRDIENIPSPPLLALPPSRLTPQEFINIHFRKVVDLGDEPSLGDASYELALLSNIPRRVRRLPALSGRSIGLLQGCTSLIKQNLPGNLWICLILVDPVADIVVHPARNFHNALESRIPQIPRRIRAEDFRDPPTYAEFQAARGAGLYSRFLGPREELLSFYSVSPPGWRAGNPSILSLSHYPIQTIIMEWMLYELLMSRYIKYYEYSFPTVSSRLEHFEKNDILDLHRWRRRSQQSLHKLQMTRRFVEHWRAKEENFMNIKGTAETAIEPRESSTWDLLVMDLKYLEGQIHQHARSLEALNPIITSLVQLIDSHKSLSQAEDIRRLTYAAIAFIPLSYITGIFSMSEPFGPGSDQFWVYWVTAVPIATLIMWFLALENRFPSPLMVYKRMRKGGKGLFNSA